MSDKENSKKPDYRYFQDSNVGMVMEEGVVFMELENGDWEATQDIGYMFGARVQGKCRGRGKTKEEALKALKEDKMKLNDSLWL